MNPQINNLNTSKSKASLNEQDQPLPDLSFPFKLVAKQLSKVDEFINAQAKSFDPNVENYVSYVCEIGGKRIRPALAILAGGSLGEVNDDHIKIGAIIELVHLATLIHDDIMDEATIRREMPTASAKWGSTLSVLLGDSLFARALELAATFDDPRICRTVAEAASSVCQGEIIQTQRRFDLTLTKKEYFKIIELKTGALFAVAAQLGARISQASDEIQLQLKEFGLKIGTAYQIYDDCIDLVGDETNTGKTLGTDLILVFPEFLPPNKRIFPLVAMAVAPSAPLGKDCPTDHCPVTGSKTSTLLRIEPSYPPMAYSLPLRNAVATPPREVGIGLKVVHWLLAVS